MVGWWGRLLRFPFLFACARPPQATCFRPTISDDFLSWTYLHTFSPVCTTHTWFNFFSEHVWSSGIIPRDRERWNIKVKLFYHLFGSRRPSTVSC
jgi:hypothetical protein